MIQLNNVDRSEFLKTGFQIISDEMEEICITNRLGCEIGIPKEIGDMFLAEKIRDSAARFGAMDDDEFMDYVDELKEGLETPVVEDIDEEDLTRDIFSDDPEDCEEMLKIHFSIIDDKIEKIMFMKSAMERQGIDPEDLTAAFKDKLQEVEDRIFGMDQDEFEQTVWATIIEMDKMLEADAGANEPDEADAAETTKLKLS